MDIFQFMIFSKKIFISLGSIISFFLIFNINMNQIIFNLSLNMIYQNTIPLIDSKEVQKSKFTILDARTKKEFEISHIRNAIWVGYEEFDFKLVQNISLNDTILIYCTIGYRSEKIGQKLKKNGLKHIYNLKGGIIQWVNDGYEIVRNEKPTNEIHPFSKAFEIWIQKGKIVYDK